MENENDTPPEPLSNDPEENLRLENELLHLKLRAQFGAASQSFSGLPPEIENEFLKNVLAFENASAAYKEDGEKEVTVYERIGKPAFIPAAEIKDDEIGAALEAINSVLEQHEIAVDFIAEYDNRLKYAFITEELFKHEMGFFSFPGMVTHYTYEEFHPNHKMDIENRAKEFLEGWFERNFNEHSSEVGDIVLPTGQVLTQMEVLEKLQNFFDCYTSFTDSAYKIFDIGFELYPETNSGMGHAEGAAKYVAMLESGGPVLIKGMFKLYMSLDHGWWHVCYFVFPGFEF